MSESEKPAVTFIGNKPRSQTIELEWPVMWNGHEYHKITLRRLSTKDVAEFITSIADRKENSEMVRFPIFIDADGAPVPPEVIDGLDDDDTAKLNEAAADFLPRRFTQATEPENGLPLTTGASTAPISEKPPAGG